jgi:hypothetical protein
VAGLAACTELVSNLGRAHPLQAMVTFEWSPFQDLFRGSFPAVFTPIFATEAACFFVFSSSTLMHVIILVLLHTFTVFKFPTSYNLF